jgi:hypothetical protein
MAAPCFRDIGFGWSEVSLHRKGRAVDANARNGGALAKSLALRSHMTAANPIKLEMDFLHDSILYGIEVSISASVARARVL